MSSSRSMPPAGATVALSPQAQEILATAAPEPVRLPAVRANCHWGYIDPDEPVTLTVDSGSVVDVETVSHHSGDAPDLMMDAGITDLWAAIPEPERAPGVHIITGPIDIRGAKPGGAVAVQILDMSPRMPFGSNCAAHWGLLYPKMGKERITIYRLDDAPDGTFPQLAQPLFGYDFTGRPLYDTPGYRSEPGTVVRQPFSRPVLVPVRPHFGVLGVAPGEPGRRSSTPPGVFGGNVDNWRFGPGATVYFPVFQEGAGIYAGDPHFAQGDGEVCGTAIEASASGRIRVAAVDDLYISSPVLETSSHWYTHGFGGDLDEAMVMAVELMIQLLCDVTGLTPDDAYSVASVAMDLAVTQVVDQVVGCHAGIARSLFA